MSSSIFYVTACTIGSAVAGGAAAQFLCAITNHETRGNYGPTSAGLFALATMFVSAGIGFGISMSQLIK